MSPGIRGEWDRCFCGENTRTEAERVRREAAFDRLGSGSLEGFPMYGVPPDLPLGRFVGHECTLIGIGRFEVRFMFPGTGDICVYGRWEICDNSGTMIDRAQEHAERICYFVHKVIDSPVHRYDINSPASFTLYFENGHSLTVFDDSERYESFSIQPDGIYV